jgi:hypothetical protein
MPSGQLADRPAPAESTVSSPLPTRTSHVAASLLHRFLPDAHDPRYPRPAAVRALRGVALLWWLPALTYLGSVITNLVLLVARGGLASLADVRHLLHAALLDLLWARLGEWPWLVVPALGALAGLALAGRWAEGDATRESRVLLLRAFREQTSRTGKAIAVGLWAARWLTTKLRHLAFRVVLGAAALAAGIVLALVTPGSLG